MSCIFCKIIKGEIPSKKIFENENILGFVDLAPQAKIHLLFVHKLHSENLTHMVELNPDHVTEVFQGISEYVKSENVFDAGFRVVTNQGKNAGQTVFHTHFHVLSGEMLGSFGR